jgi:hypothetical protein
MHAIVRHIWVILWVVIIIFIPVIAVLIYVFDIRRWFVVVCFNYVGIRWVIV